jgi:Mn2+/Fe2+ NRAMP family transporter
MRLTASLYLPAASGADFATALRPLLVNDREIMGDLANGRLANVAGGTHVVAIAAVGALYGVLTAFSNLLGT